DSTNRPSCRTDNGRTVYGGGGIVPDIELAETTTPRWLAPLNERGLFITWAGGFIGKPNALPPTVEALAASRAVDAPALSDFRVYATSNGATIPTEPGADEILSRVLLRNVAFARFGNAGYYRFLALTDPVVRTAVDAFAKADASLRPKS